MFSRIFLLIALSMSVSACGDTLLERGVTGAAIGAGTAVALDEDPATGAVLGGAVGVVTR